MQPLLFTQVIQVPHFSIAKDLDTVIRKQFDIARKSQSGTMDVFVPDFLLKPHLSVQCPQLEPLFIDFV